MNNIVPPEDHQSRIDNYIGYTSGITGSQAPGPCSAACLLISPDGHELARELMDTGIQGTGHQAEYLAVMLLSRVVKSRFALIRHLWIYCSDQLVVNQLAGTWRIRDNRFQTFVDKISEDLSVVQWGITWIPARSNQIKDWHWENYHQNSNPGETLTDPALGLQP